MYRLWTYDWKDLFLKLNKKKKTEPFFQYKYGKNR